MSDRDELREEINVAWLKTIGEAPIAGVFDSSQETIVCNFFRLGFIAGRASGAQFMATQIETFIDGKKP